MSKSRNSDATFSRTRHELSLQSRADVKKRKQREQNVENLVARECSDDALENLEVKGEETPAVLMQDDVLNQSKIKNAQTQRKIALRIKEAFIAILSAIKTQTNHPKQRWLDLLQKGMSNPYKKMSNCENPDISLKDALILIHKQSSDQGATTPHAIAAREARRRNCEARDQVFLHIYFACQMDGLSDDQSPELDFDFLKKWAKGMKYCSGKNKRKSSVNSDSDYDSAEGSDPEYKADQEVESNVPVRRSDRLLKRPAKKLKTSHLSSAPQAEFESDSGLNENSSDAESKSISAPESIAEPALAVLKISPMLAQDAIIKFLQLNPIMCSAFLFNQFGKFPGLTEEMKKPALLSVIENADKVIPAVLQQIKLIQNQGAQSSTEELQTLQSAQPLDASVQELLEEVQRQNAMLPVAPFDPDSLVVSDLKALQTDPTFDSKMDTSSNENSFSGLPSAGLPSALGLFSRPASPLPLNSQKKISLTDDAELDISFEEDVGSAFSLQR